MESRFSLRPATVEDVSKLLQIEQKLHIAPWNEKHFLDELNKPYSHFLVLTDDETDLEVAGYIVFWSLFDECQILNIAVDFPYRGLGLAKQMMRKAVSLATKKGIAKVVLEVRKSNLPAVQLYQSLGFVVTQIRQRFYSNGEDAYFMTLSLRDLPIHF